jgi:hypothetical protein
LEISNQSSQTNDDPTLLHDYVEELMNNFSDNQLDLSKGLSSVVDSFKESKFDPDKFENMIDLEQKRSKNVLQLVSFLDGQVNKVLTFFNTVFDQMDDSLISKDLKATIFKRIDVVQETVDSISSIVMATSSDIDLVLETAEQDISKADKLAALSESEMSHILDQDSLRIENSKHITISPNIEELTIDTIPLHESFSPDEILRLKRTNMILAANEKEKMWDKFVKYQLNTTNGSIKLNGIDISCQTEEEDQFFESKENSLEIIESLEKNVNYLG